MKWIAINGSPRGRNSNSRFLLDAFTAGVQLNGKHELETLDLASPDSLAVILAAWSTADRVILAFPLYTDAMPGLVKTLFELLSELRGSGIHPSVCFIVHSGFPEPIHARALEMYLDKLCRRLGCRNLGVVIKGNSEGLRQQPRWLSQKTVERMRRLGTEMGRTGSIDTGIAAQIGGAETIPSLALTIFRLLNLLGLVNLTWNRELKKNKALSKRHYRPYWNGDGTLPGTQWGNLEQEGEILR